ncbi:MAG TPA: glutaredoxin family protein [Sideroxyarcus sp.]|nr:glutaredoxin family protein [Sideroxyarcus sp.]
MPDKLKLYGSEYCHLCDEAGALLGLLGIDAEYVDIAADDELIDLYGTRIPVLQRMDTGMELDWPFGADGLTEFLHKP